MDNNEILEDIVADLRQEASDCPDIERAGIYDRYADRFEAALKREMDNIHRAMVILAGIEMESAENPSRLWTALEDAYDALSDALGTDGDITADEEEAKATGRHFVVVRPSGDCAKLREALERLCDISESDVAELERLAHRLIDQDVYGGEALRKLVDDIRKARSALSGPPRNCDLFSSEEESRAAFIDWYNEAYNLKGTSDEISTSDLKHDVNGILHDYIKWLFAPATEQKGEPYGSK